MRDPELVSRAQGAAARLESAWERWRTRQGLGGPFAQPVASYVGYAPEEPGGRPRVVFGVDAVEAEQLAALLDADVRAGAATGQRAGLPGQHADKQRTNARHPGEPVGEPPEAAQTLTQAISVPVTVPPAAEPGTAAGQAVADANGAGVRTTTVPGGSGGPGRAAGSRGESAAVARQEPEPACVVAGDEQAVQTVVPVAVPAGLAEGAAGPVGLAPGAAGPAEGAAGLAEGAAGPAAVPGRPAAGRAAATSSIAAELAGWAASELPGHASAGLAAWIAAEQESRDEAADPGDGADAEREGRAGSLRWPS
jgi:hypothetical protein